jgi:hypothetical protein
VADSARRMKRLFVAGLAGVAIAAAAFALVVAVTDLRVTTGTSTVTTTSAVSGSMIAGRTPPPCGPGRGLSYDWQQPQHGTGALAIPVRISSAKGPPCTLDANAHFSVRPKEVRAKITGSPQRWHLHGAIGEQTGVLNVFVWRNWCGPNGRFLFRFRVEGHGAAGWTDNGRTPGCEDPGPRTPSSLSRFAVSG